MNEYQCQDCGTKYHTPEDRPPPTPNWSDGHKCRLVLIKEADGRD